MTADGAGIMGAIFTIGAAEVIKGAHRCARRGHRLHARFRGIPVVRSRVGSVRIMGGPTVVAGAGIVGRMARTAHAPMGSSARIVRAGDPEDRVVTAISRP